MWWWILIWLLLLLAAAVFLGLVAWSVVKRGIRLGQQLGDSAEQVSVALEPIHEPYQPTPSVLVDPTAGADAPNPVRPERARRRR